MTIGIGAALAKPYWIGATNEGVDLLDASQIKGVPTAGFHSQAELVNELGVVSIRNAADMGYFSQKFIEAIAGHRHWLRQTQKELVPPSSTGFQGNIYSRRASTKALLVFFRRKTK